MSVKYYKLDKKKTNQLSKLVHKGIIDLNATTKSFHDLLKLYTIIVVDVYAHWCMPCTKMFPKFKELSELYSNNSNIIFCKDGIGKKTTFHGSNQSPMNSRITAVPAYIIYKQGKVVYFTMGGSIESLHEELKKFI